MITRQVRLIPEGRRNRPVTFPASSRFRRKIAPKYITIHNDHASASALAAYILTDACANRPASWHDSVDDRNWFQHLPYDESGWHAGDNLGPGNLTSIGIEICHHHTIDYEASENNGALVVAHHIRNIKSLLPFPDCMAQHHTWSGKNCPSVIRGRENGWQRFLDKVSFLLKVTAPPDLDIREVIRNLKTIKGDMEKVIVSLEQRL